MSAYRENDKSSKDNKKMNVGAVNLLTPTLNNVE